MKMLFLLLPIFGMLNYGHAETPTLLNEKKITLHASGFTENQGQVRDQHDELRKDVLYVFSQKNFSLVLRKNGFSYELIQYKNEGQVSEATGLDYTSDELQVNNDQTTVISQRFDASFKGFSSDVKITAEGKSVDYFNYYLGNSSAPALEVHSYHKIYYRNIYKNIDLVFIAPDDDTSALKYEYIIHPGGEVKDIKTEYATLNGISINDQSVMMPCSIGFVKEEKLFAYQEDKEHPLKSSFQLNKNILSFSIQKYDHSKLLVLDPDIDWGTYYGTDASVDISQEVFVDRDGNVLATGQTGSQQNFATTGAYQSVYGGLKYDAYVLKFNSAGDRLWATYYGGFGNDIGYSIYADASLNIYCGGDSRSLNDPVYNAFQPVIGGIEDAFCIKLNKDGLIRWATYYGGSDEDHNRGITGDFAGNIYFTGYTKSENNISTPNVYQPVKAPLMDAFLIKFDSTGLRLWGTYYGGSDSDRAHACTVDKNQNVIITGTTPSNNGIATPGAHQTVCGGNVDMFIAKFKPNGQRLWGTYYGGSEEEHGRECTTDKAGNIYVTGYTASETQISTPDGYQPLWATGYNNHGGKNPDAYYAKFDPHGVQLYGTYLGGTEEDRCRTIRLEPDGSVILSGTTESGGLATNGVYQQQLSGLRDIFIAKFMTSGKLDWLTYYGGAGDEDGEGLAVDNSGGIYISGSTVSESGIATPGAFKEILTTTGADDCVIAKFIDRCYDRYEPNNSKFSATPVTASPNNSTLVNGQIKVPGDQDFYSFSNQASSSNIKIELTNLPKNFNIYLLGTNGQVIAQSVNTAKMDEKIIFNTSMVGTYKVKVQGKGSAFSDTICYDLTVSLSNSPFNGPNEKIGNAPGENQISLYPNPAQSQLTLSFPTAEKLPLITVYDLNGAIIDLPFSFHLVGVKTELQLNTSSLTDGFYMIQLLDEVTGIMEFAKFVKKSE